MADFSNNAYAPTAEYKIIYIYAIHDEAHKDILKIGKGSFNSMKSEKQLPPDCPELVETAKSRIDEQTKTALIKYELLHTELAIKHFVMADGTMMTQSFEDHDVHTVLYNSHYKSVKFMESGKPSEWFMVDLETAKNAITAVKKGQSILIKPSIETSSQLTIEGGDISQPEREPSIKFRDEQLSCVDKTIDCFKKSDSMLWDCKMRFGKTVTAYELIRRKIKDFKKVIVITHRPAVEDGWDSDHDLIFGKNSSHVFIDKSRGSEDSFDENIDSNNNKVLHDLVSQDAAFTYFASIQDLRGSQRVGGKFKKNEGVFDLDWDLLIIDEAHEGTKTDLGEKVITALKKGHTKCLQLSGTPYNLIDKFEDNVFSWTYVDEQKAKAEWEDNHPGEKNPYAELPKMNILTFDLNNALADSYLFETFDAAFNFREFFRTWTGDKDKDFRPIPEGAKIGDFVHEKDVNAFLDLITTDDSDSNYPFSTEEKRDMFRHTFWLVPGVKEAKALSALLRVHPVFKNYYPINVAGEGDEEVEYDTALGAVREAISKNDFTITISCGRLTTGITVREWTGAMMLSGSAKTSAGGYMQAIFRVQSPGCVNGKQKENVYVFDFAPDRALTVIGEVHSLKRGESNSESGRVALGEFLNFCPVLAVEGTVMKPYDVSSMMKQIKKISIEAAISSGFDDDSVFDRDAGIVLKDGDEEIFKKLSDIMVPQGKSKKKKAVTVNDNGLTEEERRQAEEAERKKKKGKGKELTPEQKAALEKLKKQREEQKKLFNLLRAISIRLPLLFYGADADITEAITLENFVEIVDDESWEEFMPNRLKKDFFLQLLRYFDKDVVEGAGLRIRRIAKAADEMLPTQRAKRIVEILSAFKNPDKETVLTPWRVVNMHLSDTIGGYCFFNEDFTKELDEPRLVEQGEITSNVFLNPDVKILEMNSKSGLYPLYMAFSVYMLLVDGKEDDMSFEKTQEIWKKTISDHIYVLCKTKMAKSITQRTLMGYKKNPINAIYLPHLLERMQNKERLAKKLTNPATWGKEGERMFFGAIAGNPPYQEEVAQWNSETNGQARRKNIFPMFQELADSIPSCYSSLIYPGARWIHRSGKGTEKFGLNQINDLHLEKIIFYSDANEIFSDVAIADGISIVLKNNAKTTPGFIYCYHKDHSIVESFLNNPGDELIPLNPLDSSIVEKISTFVVNNSLDYLHNRVLPQKLFGIESDFVENNPKSVRSFEENAEIDYANEIKLYANDKAGKAGRTTWFITSPDVIPNNKDLIYEWQVVVSSANAGGQKRDNQLEIIDNHSAFGRSRVALGTFKTKVEAENFYNYVNTSVIKFCFLLTDEALTSLGKKVPDLLDYTNENTLIDFSAELNKQLIELIGLDESEVVHIEATLNNR